MWNSDPIPSQRCASDVFEKGHQRETVHFGLTGFEISPFGPQRRFWEHREPAEGLGCKANVFQPGAKQPVSVAIALKGSQPCAIRKLPDMNLAEPELVCGCRRIPKGDGFSFANLKPSVQGEGGATVICA